MLQAEAAVSPEACSGKGPENTPDTDPSKERNALSLLHTVIMSFARGLTSGKPDLPVGDTRVYFPVQLVKA